MGRCVALALVLAACDGRLASHGPVEAEDGGVRDDAAASVVPRIRGGGDAGRVEPPPFSFVDPFPPAAAGADPVRPDALLAEALSSDALPLDRPVVAGGGLAGLTVEWSMRISPPHPSTAPSGTLVDGPGFRLEGQANFGDHGAMLLRIRQSRGGVYLGERVAVVSLALPDGLLHRYAVTYDLRTVTAYVDGEVRSRRWLDNETDRIGPMDGDGGDPPMDRVRIGGGRPGAPVFSGTTPVDSVRVWSVALDGALVRRSFEDTRGYRTLFASTAGRPDASGGASDPLTLAAALARCGPSTRIVVEAGDYDGSDIRLSPGGRSPLEHCLVVGADGAAPIVIHGPLAVGASHVTLRNLTLAGAASGPALAVSDARGVRVEACTVIAPGDGITALRAPDLTVESSVIAAGATGIAIVDSSNAVLRNDTIAGGEIGVWLEGASAAPTLLDDLLTGQRVACVAIAGAGAERYRGDANLYDPAPGGSAAVVDGVAFERGELLAYSAHWYARDVRDAPDPRGRRRGYAAESRSFELEPRFVDAATGDFRLAAVAPGAMDAGVDHALQRPVQAALFDRAGRLRPLGNAVDVGAFEWAPPPRVPFVLSVASRTSAGVYRTDGTLVRTLWSGRSLPAGEHVAYWNGLDDLRAPVPPGEHELRIIAHDIRYLWEGVVANSSSPPHGPGVHATFHPIQSMAFAGETGFYTPGYNEGKHELFRFDPRSPSRVTLAFGPVTDIFSDSLVDVAADAERLYARSSSALFVYDAATGERASFAGAPTITVGSPGGLAAVAVNDGGPLLFVAHTTDGRIHALDKRTGAPAGAIELESAGDLAVAPDGDLWAIGTLDGARVVLRYDDPPAGAVATTVRGLSDPRALAVLPDGTLLVADAGTSHQVKAFSADGEPLFTLGDPGGQPANGPDVTDGRFGLDPTFLAVEPDGHFWVGDGGNRRALRFGPDRSVVGRIECVGATYAATVDANDARRVFNRYLELAVDYDRPLAAARLVRNWGHGLPETAYGFADGLASVATLSNGRTYAFVPGPHPGRQLVELTAAGVRVTALPTFHVHARIAADGSIVSHALGADGRVSFARRPLLGFDAAGDPRFGADEPLASAPAVRSWLRDDPVGDRPPVVTGDLVVSFDDSRERLGFHLGAVRIGGRDWIWRAAPTVGGLDGAGTFDSFVEYGGNLVLADGHDVFFGFHGEFYQDAGQAHQVMHFRDDGLFLGQLGYPAMPGTALGAPGSAGNAFSPALARAGDALFLYHNDEWGRGSHRWRIDGRETIEELRTPVTLPR